MSKLPFTVPFKTITQVYTSLSGELRTRIWYVDRAKGKRPTQRMKDRPFGGPYV